MTLYSFFHKRPILHSSVQLNEKLVEKLNNSRYNKEDINFWKYFSNYHFDLSEDLLIFSLDRDVGKDLLGYSNLFYADFQVYMDSKQRVKLKLIYHYGLFGFSFMIVVISFLILQYFDFMNILFFILGVFTLVEFLWYDINNKKLDRIKYFINKTNNELYNPHNED